MMKANEIRKMSAAELEAKLVELKKDLFMLRMQHATNQLDNPLQIAVVKKDSITFYDHDDKEITKEIHEVTWSAEAAEKGGYAHFMLKEIFDQPDCISDCMRGRVNTDTCTVTLSAVSNYKEQLLRAGRFIIVACGTSWHAGLIGKQMIENYCRIPVEVEYASESVCRSSRRLQG